MLHDRLRERQRELGLRDGQMADLLGVPRTTYNMFKTSSRRPSMYMVRRIVRAFPDLKEYALAGDDEPVAN